MSTPNQPIFIEGRLSVKDNLEGRSPAPMKDSKEGTSKESNAGTCSPSDTWGGLAMSCQKAVSGPSFPSLCSTPAAGQW